MRSPSVNDHQFLTQRGLRSSRNSSKSNTQNLQYLNLRNGQEPVLYWQKTSLLPGAHSTPSTGESPRDAVASTLSQILMVNVPETYRLSQRACLGILRRCKDRGKKLLEILKKALLRQSQKYATGPGEMFQMDWGFVKVVDRLGKEWKCFLLTTISRFLTFDGEALWKIC